MARSIDEIQQEIIQNKDNDVNLADLNSPSATAIWRLWTRIIAVAINLFEQILDSAIATMEQSARDAIAGTPDWLQRRVLEFQFSLSDPQVVSVIDGVASYPVISENLRIVTRASIKEQANGRVLLKVAKGGSTLEKLDNNELNALKGYVDKIGFAGIPIDTISLDADRLRFEGTVFYSGENVESEVKDAVKEGISNYLASVSINDFDGVVVREKLIDSIQSVTGVTGVDTLGVVMTGRPEQSPLGGNDNTNIDRLYETRAGYIIEEDTAGNTFDDTITMQLG